MTTTQLKNKPEYVTQTYNFKDVINHIDIVQAEAKFMLNPNHLITRTLVDYEAKTITIEAYNTNLFHPVKEHNRGFIFDISSIKDINHFSKVFEPLGITSDDFTLYSKENKIVTTSNKLTKEIIKSAKEIIELENRSDTFTKTYYFDKRPTVQDLLNSQLNFLVENKLHEDDITFVGIDTNEESPFSYKNTITITGKQSAKHKTYSDDVATVINSCVIVDRFDSLLESAMKEGGSDDVIQRVISFQHPVVDNETFGLLKGSVDISGSLHNDFDKSEADPDWTADAELIKKKAI